jgi:hypothetical protein
LLNWIRISGTALNLYSVDNKIRSAAIKNIIIYFLNSDCLAENRINAIRPRLNKNNPIFGSINFVPKNNVFANLLEIIFIQRAILVDKPPISPISPFIMKLICINASTKETNKNNILYDEILSLNHNLQIIRGKKITIKGPVNPMSIKIAKSEMICHG